MFIATDDATFRKNGMLIVIDRHRTPSCTLKARSIRHARSRLVPMLRR